MKLGTPAPDFKLPSQDGKEYSLADFKGKNLVLFFFPKTGTPVCTAEACSFRDSYEDFQEAGAEVVGISSDTKKEQKEFAQNHRLPFILLSDKNGQIRKRFEVPSTLGIFPGRVTYVIDKQGIVRHIFNSQLNAQKHISQALSFLKSTN